MTSESTRFLGQPREMKPTVGGASGEILLTLPLYREALAPFMPLRDGGQFVTVNSVSEVAVGISF